MIAARMTSRTQWLPYILGCPATISSLTIFQSKSSVAALFQSHIPPLKGAEADALLPVSDPEIVYRDVAPEDVEGIGPLHRDTL